MSRATSWRVKRLISGANTDPKKRAHADYVRFSRALGSINQKGNDIFIDGRDTGRERHVYIIVRSRKGRNFTYATYNSNPDEDWVPPTKEVFPVVKASTPKDFKDSKKTDNRGKWRRKQNAIEIPPPPLMHFKIDHSSSESE